MLCSGFCVIYNRYDHWFSVDTETQNPVLGQRKVTDMMYHQLQQVKAKGTIQMHNAPSLVGEVGIPYNMHNGEAFTSNDW